MCIRDRFKTTRPDVDNLMKPVQDSLKKLLKDDNQIVYPEVVKIHSENEFVFVKLIEIDYKGIKIRSCDLMMSQG